MPMFAYTDDSGQRHMITGKEGHFFRHLRNKVNEAVNILVLPDNASEPRLGDLLSLYSNGALLGLIGSAFFILPLYGARFIGNRAAQAAAVLSENQLPAWNSFDKFGQSRLPGWDLVIVLVGFILIAGGIFGYAYSFFRKFIDKDEDVKFRFESNGNLTSVLSISEIDDKKLTCDRFIQTNTKKTEKKIIGFNSNAANKRIVVLLTEYFTQGLRKGSYEIKDSGDLDLYVYMECTASPKIVISEPRPGSQKFACLLANKIENIKYENIEQKKDDLIHGKAVTAVRLNFDCNERRSAAIASAIEDYFAK